MSRWHYVLAVGCWWAALCGRAMADEPSAATANSPESTQLANSAQPAEIFKQLDSNGDGQISQEEAPAERRQFYKRLLRRADANGDGNLSEAEFLAGMSEDRPALPAETPSGAGDLYSKFLEADSGELFRRLDANGDGKIVRNELPEPIRARFEQFMENFDVNRDQALTREEFVKGHAMLRTQAGVAPPARAGGAGAVLLRALDSDGDGKLSKEEIQAATASLLALDEDGDGALNGRELMARRAKGPPATVEKTDKENVAAKPAGQKLPDLQRLLARLRGMDDNGDGKWSESELPPFLKKQFNKIDANGDGLVDTDEVQQAIEVMRQRAEKRAARIGKQ